MVVEILHGTIPGGHLERSVPQENEVMISIVRDL